MSVDSIAMLSPEGKSGDVPLDRISDALAAGFVRAVKLRNPNTQEELFAPYDVVAKYLSAGYRIVHDQ
jgi:hypothetical protein